mmetsp:Transcript_28221/g.73170  ORF Transcript_28221/g.73170 Transcript_28221/m.73170 type:complete len:165 (+) Transcript_28221:263-757(+)|eukprot:jgi/Tetstr1/458345/TSEL_044784.t1
MAARLLSASRRVAGQAGNLGFGGHALSAGFATASGDIKEAFKYCKEQVRRFDHDNYLWCLLLPKETQAAALCLRAFNVETALVADASKEMQIQQMRMLWWREAVKAIFSSKEQPPNHPVVQALEYLAAVRPLSRYWLQRIISAREADLTETAPPATLAQLEASA